MKIVKRWYFIIIAIVLLLGVAYIIWNSMNLQGNWLKQADEVDIEWYDIKGIRHFYKLSDSQKDTLATQLNEIVVEQKLYFLPASRSGEQSYKIYYHGTQNVIYTVKSSGLLIVQNQGFPYQHSIWKIRQMNVDEFIEFINLLTDTY